MMQNKVIDRNAQNANKIFNQRSLGKDYRTLFPLLKEGMRVLDIGCGTGAITKDIARIVGDQGHVTGIDNTESFILEGRKIFGTTKNLDLIHVDLFEYQPDEKFDLVVSARTFQWISTVNEAIAKIKKDLLKSNGQISILDYNHNQIEWCPSIPKSMQHFYDSFLQWRQEAEMNNQIADDLPEILKRHGFQNISTEIADEKYEREHENHLEKIQIWAKVAKSSQMVEEGYIEESLRTKAIEDYINWSKKEAISMTMKLRDVRASL